MTVSIEKQVDTMAAQSVVARRRPGAQSRIVVLEQCAAPQASVAKVAMPHGLNANLVHGWRKPARERDGAALLPSRPVCVPVNPAATTRTGSPQFVPVSLDAMAGEPAPVDIQIEAWKFNAGTPPAQARGPAGAPAARGPWARTSAGGWTSNRRSSSCSARSAAIQGEGPPAPEPGVQVLPAPGAGAGRAPGLDNALPTPGLQAQTVLSRFVDHITYDRQQQINARSGVHTPRSTLAACSGHTGAPSLPL